MRPSGDKQRQYRLNKTGVSGGLTHKHARMTLLKAEPFAQLNINPAWLAFAGKCFYKCHLKKQ